jgi:hypothetical protein
MSLCIGRLDLAMSILLLETLNDTNGNIVYIDLKIVPTDSAVFSKRRVFRGHDRTMSI